MPRVNIWIRNEDWDRWQAIANKPEWLHEHLNSQKSFRAMGLDGQVAYVKRIIDDDSVPVIKDLPLTYTQPEDTA